MLGQHNDMPAYCLVSIMIWQQNAGPVSCIYSSPPQHPLQTLDVGAYLTNIGPMYLCFAMYMFSSSHGQTGGGGALQPKLVLMLAHRLQRGPTQPLEPLVRVSCLLGRGLRKKKSSDKYEP